MLKISRTTKKFDRLETPTLTAAAILERADLQEYIYNSPDAFFNEIDEKLCVLGKEVMPSETVQDRIDLLAIDREGRLVIVELKRGNDRYQLLQAISYAAMISKWKWADIAARTEATEEVLQNFLDDDEVEKVNEQQRIILVAEAYDYEVLAAAEWLFDKYGVEIICARVSLARDAASGAEYLSCTQILPAPELAQQAITRGRRTQESVGPKSWEAALARVQEPTVADFFRRHIECNQENLPGKHVIFRSNGRRRFSVNPRLTFAFAFQRGRFEGDFGFWKERLSRPDYVRERRNGRGLAFDLITAADFAEFEKVMKERMPFQVWLEDKGADNDAEEIAEAATA